MEEIIPGGGEVADLELTGDEGGFKLEAEQDMEVVGNLVGLDADEGAFHRIGGAPALLPVVTGEVGKRLRQVGPPGFPERVAASDAVFPKPGLGFVDPEGGGLTQRSAELHFRKALVVESVAGLV